MIKFPLCLFFITSLAVGCKSVESIDRTYYLDDSNSGDDTFSKIDLKSDELISIYTNKEIVVASQTVNFVEMRIVSSNATKVLGKVVFVEMQGPTEEASGTITEVKFEDMKKIQVWGPKTYEAAECDLCPFIEWLLNGR